MKTYGSFCPIAKASEILAERWTLLVVRDLLLGARRFNDLHRGVPNMSPTLLSKRLQTLEASGLVVRSMVGGNPEYLPTKACEDLRPIIEAIGHWGQRWVRSQLEREELNVGELMWYIRRHFVRDKLPRQRIVLQIDITDVRRLGRWWLIVEPDGVDLCVDDPGHEIDIALSVKLRTLAQLYIGDETLERAVIRGDAKLNGPRALVRSMPHWFARSKFASDNPMQET